MSSATNSATGFQTRVARVPAESRMLV